VAWTLLGTIAADPLDRAELLCLEASLAQDARKPEQAGLLLDEALAIYQESGERRLLGQALIQKGMLLGTLGRQEAAVRAVDLLREGLARIEERIQPGLAAETLYRLAGLLQEAGSDEQALQAVDRARDLYEALGDRPNLLRLRRLEGRVEESRENLEAAEAVYREVWEAFLAMDLGREAGISLVHLALLHARQGRTQEVFRLSQELSPILRAQDVRQSPDSLAALLAFRRLAEGGSAVPELLVEVQHCLAGPRAPAGSAPIARIETPTPYAMAFLLSPAGSRDDRLAARVPRAGPAGID
jgi:tetratricopeptide (TPR) repeat protein